jgi:nickel/cobalt transporter (NicO) family protein
LRQPARAGTVPPLVHPALLSLLVGLGQGLLHGLGPDHCAAIATLGASGDRRKSLRVALSFAWGHTLVLGALAGVCLALGVGLSEAFERWAERLGGFVLVAIALAALLFPGTLEHGHPTLPHHKHDHDHHHHGDARLGGVAGALMAVSGVRALALALPPLLVGGALHLAGWVYLPAFGAGVFLSMAFVGLAVSAGTRRLSLRGASWLQRAVALSSGALGLVWIAVA